MAKVKQLVAILTAILLLFGILPVLVRLFGITFLPSPEWTSKTSSLAQAAGLGMMMLSVSTVLTAKNMPSGRSFKKLSAIVGAAPLGFLAGSTFVVIAGPMILALIAGRQVERTFTVTHSDHIGTKGCHSPIGLQGLPFLFDELCGVPDEFRQGIAPGTRVVVTGFGTNIGVFANNVSRAD